MKKVIRTIVTITATAILLVALNVNASPLNIPGASNCHDCYDWGVRWIENFANQLPEGASVISFTLFESDAAARRANDELQKAIDALHETAAEAGTSGIYVVDIIRAYDGTRTTAATPLEQGCWCDHGNSLRRIRRSVTLVPTGVRD